MRIMAVDKGDTGRRAPEKASAHALPKDSQPRMVNGHIVGPTLVDQGLRRIVADGH